METKRRKITIRNTKHNTKCNLYIKGNIVTLRQMLRAQRLLTNCNDWERDALGQNRKDGSRKRFIFCFNPQQPEQNPFLCLKGI